MWIKHSISLAVLVGVGSTPAELDEACIRMCEHYLHPCPETRCDSSGLCESIMWSDAARSSLVDVSFLASISSDLVAVSCQSALEAFPEAPRPLKRTRRTRGATTTSSLPYADPDSERLRSSSEQYRGGAMIRAGWGATPLRIISTGADPTLSPDEFEELVSDPTTTTTTADPETMENGEEPEEVFILAQLSDDEDSHGESSNQEEEEDDSDGESSTVVDEPEEDDVHRLFRTDEMSRRERREIEMMMSSVAQGGSMSLVMPGMGGSVMMLEINGGRDSVELDPLEDHERWIGLTHGAEVRENMEMAAAILASSDFVSDLEAFPFGDHWRDPDMLTELKTSLEGFWKEIRPYLDPSTYNPNHHGRRQTERMISAISEIPVIRRWGQALATATAVAVNQPKGNEYWEKELSYVKLHMECYTSLQRVLRKNVNRLLDSTVQAALDLWDDDATRTRSRSHDHTVQEQEVLIPPDFFIASSDEDSEPLEPTTTTTTTELPEEFEEPRNPFADITVPRHNSAGCKLCRLLSGGVRPRTLSQLGAGLATILADEGNWKGTRRAWTRDHIDDFLEAVNVATLDSEDVESFCKSGNATTIFEFVHEKIVSKPSEEFSSTDTANFLNIASLCLFDLPTPVRRDMVPDLLYGVYPPTHWAARHPQIEVNQTLTGMAFFVEVADALATLSRFDLTASPLSVRFTGSRSVGEGPRTEMINRAVAEAFDPANGLFAYSDNRQLSVRPVPLGSSDQQERYLRMAGRLLGLAIQNEITPTVSFTRGCLAHLRAPIEALPSDDPRVLEQYLLQEQPDKYSALTALRAGIGAMEGMEFTNPETGLQEELSTDNVESYIHRQLQIFVLEEVEAPMNLVLRGVYDVIAFPRLAWLQVPELEVLLEGSRDINRLALRSSATMIVGSIEQPANAPVPRELRWFWEIVDEMTDDELRDLLQFVSGGRNEPLKGFAGTKGDKKWLQVKLDSSIRKNQFPKAQVCFTQIRLPHYSSKKTMRKQLLFAIGNCKSMDHH